jgi:hypothetical protein
MASQRQRQVTWGGAPEPRRTPSSATLSTNASGLSQLSDSGIGSVSQDGHYDAQGQETKQPVAQIDPRPDSPI